MPTAPTTYLNTPLAYTRNPATFRRIFEAGRSSIIRIATLGDSQDTTPGGFGEPFNFGLNKALSMFYGNSPATCLNTGGNFGAFGSAHSVQGKFGVAGRQAISPAASTTPTSEVLPATTIQCPNTTANYQSGQLGIFLMNNISATCPFNRNSNYFDYSGGVRQETYAFTRSGASPMTIGNAYNATHAHSFTLSDFQTAIDFGQDNATLAIVKHVSNLMTAPTSSQYLQTGVKLSSGAGPIEVYGWRFLMEAARFGAIVDAFGFGGYTTEQWLTAFNGTGKMLKGTGPYNIVTTGFGANDSTTKTKAQFKADTLSLIDYIRSAMGDGNFPIIITSDFERICASAPIRAEYQQYPIACWEIANENNNIMAVNYQRITNILGMTEADMTFTGLTSRGAWSSAAVAYVVNDYVAIDAFPGATGVTNRGTFWYKCVSNHTSSASNGPVDSQYWVPICRFSFDTDGVHSNFFAADQIAQAGLQAMLSASYANTVQDFRPWVR